MKEEENIEKIPKVVKLVDIFGPFARPYLNMALSNEQIDYTWKKYFSSLKFSWKHEFHEAKLEVEKGLKLTKPEGSVYYILLSRKLFFLMMEMRYKEGDSLYFKLLRNGAKIPPLARKYVVPILLGYQTVRKKEKNIVLKRVRIWSNKYADDYGAHMLLLMREAHEKVERGRRAEGFSFLLKSFKIAKAFPHPLGITDTLNDMAWYIRHRHPCWAHEIAKRALYQVGWYRENLSSIFYALDTLFECQKIVKSVKLYESATVMSLVSYHLPEGLGRKTRLHYKKRIDECAKISPNFEVSEYENTLKLRNYISKSIPSLKNIEKITGIAKKNIIAILMGRTKKIKGKTLRKFLKAIKVDSPIGVPFAFWNEAVKSEIDALFFKALKKIENVSEKEKRVEFLSTYMAYIDRRKSLPYLSTKKVLLKALDALRDVEEFRTLMSKRYETKTFVGRMALNAHPFLKARKELAKKFLEYLERRDTMDEFVNLYIHINGTRPFLIEWKRERLDRFVRNYVRYDRKWGKFSLAKSFFDEVHIPDELEVIQRRLRLKKIPTLLAYYSLEEEKERRLLLNVLKIT